MTQAVSTTLPYSLQWQNCFLLICFYIFLAGNLKPRKSRQPHPVRFEVIYDSGLSCLAVVALYVLWLAGC